LRKWRNNHERPTFCGYRVFTDISKNKDTIVASWGELNFRLNCVYCDGYEWQKTMDLREIHHEKRCFSQPATFDNQGGMMRIIIGYPRG